MRMLFFALISIWAIITHADEIREVTFDISTELDLSQDLLVDVPASPDAGFHFPYFLFIPQSVPGNQPLRILVAPNNSGQTSDDFSLHRDRAKMLASRGYVRSLAEGLGTPLLVPVFPRPLRIARTYTHALDRDAMLIEEGRLKRIDLQLMAMIQHAQEMLQENGLEVKPRVFMNGFSASGNFVNRFVALHPERVRAVATGGVNGLPIFPLIMLEGTHLPYPIGIGDLEAIADIQFDMAAYKRVSQFIYMGRFDENDTLPYSDAWNRKERELIKTLFGEEMMPSRWERSQAILSELELPVQCVTYNGTGHTIRPEMQKDIEAFLRANDGDGHVEITSHQYPVSKATEIKEAHIKALLWRGDQKIPEEMRDFPKGCDFAIVIEEWIEGQNWDQLDRFYGEAGLNFVLKAKGFEDIRVTPRNYWGNQSFGHGVYQAYLVDLRSEQLEEMARSVPYTLHPINAYPEYFWTVNEGVALVRRRRYIKVACGGANQG